MLLDYFSLGYIMQDTEQSKFNDFCIKGIEQAFKKEEDSIEYTNFRTGNND